jgi:o-succinylbenzoate synthase
MIRIDRVELRRVRLPLVHQFRTSSHAKRELEHILVTLTSTGGAVGWGEIASPSGPYYSAETVDSCWAVARSFLAPLVLNTAWEHPSELAAAMGRVRGNHFARAGFDMAAWALWSGASGVPLAKALGGDRAEVEAGVSLGIEATVDDLLEQVAPRVGEGYRRIKLKIAPGWDVTPVRAVRAAFPDVPVHVDANGAYPAAETGVFRQLDELGLVMIEQPYAPRALLAHAALQTVLRTPICLDDWAPAGFSTSRCRGWAVSPRRCARTIWPARTTCRCGAAACTSSASAGPPTWLSARCPVSPCRPTCPGPTSTTPATSPPSRSSAPAASSRSRPDRASAVPPTCPSWPPVPPTGPNSGRPPRPDAR